MKRILLAEDDFDDQEIFKEVISQIDDKIDLRIVSDGEILLQEIDGLPDTDLPDLIVLDQNMPRLKGRDTISALRAKARYASIPMVIYSTYHDARFMANCRASGIDLHLKPDTFDELVALMEKIIADLIKK